MRFAFICTIIAASATLPGLVGPAQAEDWNGPYAGLALGYAGGAANVTTNVDCTPITGYVCYVEQPLTRDNGPFVSAFATGPASDDALTGSFFAGFNRQSGAFVYGAEADIAAAPLTLVKGGSAASINAGLLGSTFQVNTTLSSDWLATARARAGFLLQPNLLLYATAGVGFANFTISNRYSDDFTGGGGSGAIGTSSQTALRVGLAFGGGVEWALARHWTVRAEYLHAEFGAMATTAQITYPPATLALNPLNSRAGLALNLWRAGLAYRF